MVRGSQNRNDDSINDVWSFASFSAIECILRRSSSQGWDSLSSHILLFLYVYRIDRFSKRVLEKVEEKKREICDKMVFIFISGGGGVWITIGMTILSMFGFNVDQSYQVMVVIAIAAIAAAALSTTFREALAPFLPPYFRDMIFNDEVHERPRQRNTQRDEEWTDIADKIRNTPIETYTKALSSLSTKELKKRLKNRDVDTRHCVERKELLDLLCKNSRGTSENCIICFEDYEEGDAMRVLSACKHTYHIECIDRWAFAKKSQAKCPMCNTPIR